MMDKQVQDANCPDEAAHISTVFTLAPVKRWSYRPTLHWLYSTVEGDMMRIIGNTKVLRRRRQWIGSMIGLIAIVAPVTALGAAPSTAGAAPVGATGCAPLQHIAGAVSWPSATWRVCVGGNIAQSSPTVLTYGTTTYLAVGDESGYVHLLNAATGQEAPGWPERMRTPAGDDAAIESSPTFAYLNGPTGPPSLIATSGSTWVPDSVGEVEAFTLAGKVKWIFRVGSATGTTVGVISTPAVAYLTGGRSPDLVFGSWDHEIYALNSHGHNIAGFPINSEDTVWSSPAVLGHNIYIGSDASGRLGCVGGFLTDYLYVAGQVKTVWNKCFNQTIWSSPAVGVLTTAARPVVVVGTGENKQPFPSDTYKINAFYADNGAPVAGYPVATTGPTYGSPAIGVLGHTHAVVDISWSCSSNTQASCGSHSVVRAWGPNGRELWSTTLLGPTAFGSPILVPLTGGSTNDVLVGTPNALYALNGISGGLMFGTNASNPYASINPSCRVYNAPAAGDVVSNGVDQGWSVFEACGGPRAFHVSGEIVSFKLPSTVTSSPWAMFHADPTHDGVSSQ